MSSRIFCVADYILQQTGRITTMKLQKLVYYCQAWSLAWDEKPLFDEDFQAWANGPVCPQLYHLHKGQFQIEKDHFIQFREECNFSDDEIETMKSVLDYYGEKAPHWLSELTHKEAPWKNARRGIPAGYPSETVIRKEDIQNYYSGLIDNE